MDIEQWKIAYQEAMNNPPKAKTEITGKDGEVRLYLDVVKGKEPFIYGFMHLNNVVGEEPKWYARSVNDEAKNGWKLILLPQAKQKMIKDKGLDWTSCGVLALRLVREAPGGKSFLCDVVEA